MEKQNNKFKRLQLPSSINKKISEANDNNEENEEKYKQLPKTSINKASTRKELRKQERLDKKKRKNDFFKGNNEKKKANNEQIKKVKLNNQTQTQPTIIKKQQNNNNNNNKINNQKKVQTNEEKKEQFLKSIGKSKMDLMSQDDKDIEMFGKKLGLKVNKKEETKPTKSKSNEGYEGDYDVSHIDDLFDDLEKDLAGNFDSDDDDQDQENDFDFTSYNPDDIEDYDEIMGIHHDKEGDDSEDMEEDMDQEEIGEFSDEEDDEEDDDEDEDDEENLIKEDIYGRMVNKKTGEIVKDNKGIGHGGSSVGNGKYVPPHLRNKTENTTTSEPLPTENNLKTKSKAAEENLEIDINLKRKVKGLLNRLAINNFYSIFNEISELFEKNPRGQLKYILTDLILVNSCDSHQILHSLVQIGSALITSLHSSLGTDIGGYFLEKIFHQFKSLYQLDKQSSEIYNQLNNLLLFFVHLYNFQVVGSTLIFDLTKLFIESFKDLDIQLLLLVIQNCGHQLRTDDTVVLKDIIQMVSKKITSFQSEQEEKGEEKNARLSFMMDTISNLKNNKVKTDSKLYDTIQNIKKVIRSLLKSKEVSLSNNAMRITWNDLENIETKGRWWLVGSSWAGNSQLLFKEGGIQSHQSALESELKAKIPTFNSKLIQLALANKMNTDLRKTIFCTLMTSEDYQDAFEKLTGLGLKGDQDREIINVIMHCCLKEKKFNPYYYHIIYSLCLHNRSFKYTIQYHIWDLLSEFANAEDVTSSSILRASNLSNLLARLVESEVFSLSILRNVDFHHLNPLCIVFFRIFFTYILTLPTEMNVTNIFQRLVEVTETQKRSIVNDFEADSNSAEYKTNLLRKGIRVFFLHGLISNNSPSDPKEISKLNMIKHRSTLAKTILKSDDNILL